MGSEKVGLGLGEELDPQGLGWDRGARLVSGEVGQGLGCGQEGWAGVVVESGVDGLGLGWIG